MPELEIRLASSDADYVAFGELIRQYVAWCRIRYHDDVWFIKEVFGHQSLDTELKNLQHAYGAPQGATFLALRNGDICGGGAYRSLPDGSCEMKRLFVPDQFHGMGVGRALCQHITSAARAAGFSCMKLDTARRLTEAIALYTRNGFVQCEPYYAYPEKLMPHIIFLKLEFKPDARVLEIQAASAGTR